MFHACTRPLAALGVLLLVGGCALGDGEPSFGDRLLTEGGEVSAIGQKWTEGEEAITRGRALIEDGREDIDDGEDLVERGRKKERRGEDLVEKGERLKREAERAYRERTASSGTTGS